MATKNAAAWEQSTENRGVFHCDCLHYSVVDASLQCGRQKKLCVCAKGQGHAGHVMPKKGEKVRVEKQGEVDKWNRSAN
jgi:hypothetical protein